MSDTNLTATTLLDSLSDNDAFYVLDAPAPAPVSRKLTLADLRTALGHPIVVASVTAPTVVRSMADYKCDGAADQDQINAALAALPPTGGMVLLTEGVFNLSGSILIQTDSVFLCGSGPGARTAAADVGRGTYLKAGAGLTTAVIKVQNAADNEPVYGVTIRDLNVDGNGLAGAVDGILFKSDQGLIENVYVHTCTGDGIQLEAYSGAELFDTRVVGCISSHNAGSGLFLNSYAADSRVLDCTLYTNAGSGLRVKAGGCQAVGGQYYNNSDYGIWFDAGGNWFMASDIKIENSGKQGIYFDAAVNGMEYINIVGCTFRYNGKSADATYAHISGTGNQQCSNVNICGNRFSGKPDLNPDNKATYAIDIWNASGPKYWLVAGNVFAQPTANHFRSGAVRNAGLHCKVRANQGCPDSGLVGTGLIASGTTAVTITHNLPYTPTAQEILITPTNNPTNDPGNWWVDAITSTQFKVNCRANPGASGFSFSYHLA